MAEVQSEKPGNVRDIVNRLSRDMTNRPHNQFSVHQQAGNRVLPTVSSQSPTQLFVATYAYSSKQDDELSFVVGDIIELITEVEDGWAKGKLKSTGQIGMFPTNFVAPKPAPTASNTTTTTTTASTSASRPKIGNSEVVMRPEPKAIDRTPSTIISDQLPSMKASEGKVHGIASTMTSFPENMEADTSKTKEMARVKFVYNPQHDDELALKDIDMLINITNKNCGDAGWFEGELHGKKGLFPDNFVELVQVPPGTESGIKYASVSRQANLAFVAHKPPPVNPPQPAVPPKPTKIVSNDSIPPSSTITSSTSSSQPSAPAVSTSIPSNMPVVGSSSAGVKNNFAALREKMSNNLKVVAPEKVASIQQKPTEQRDRSSTTESSTGEPSNDTLGGGDQVAELQHITKNRARPPKNRPMSMVMSRNRSSDESPTGRLSSPTSAASINPMSASMFAPAAAREITIPSNNSSTPFKASSTTPSTLVPPSSASKPALRPIVSNSFQDSNDSSSTRKLTSPDRQQRSPDVSSSDYVSRAEYDALMDRFRALESRVIALEKLRF